MRVFSFFGVPVPTPTLSGGDAVTGSVSGAAALGAEFMNEFLTLEIGTSLK